MLELQKGSIVLSKAGRDKGRFMLVLSVDGEFAFLADGKLRMLSSPKKKKVKHLALTKQTLEFDNTLTDKKLRTLLKEMFSEKEA